MKDLEQQLRKAVESAIKKGWSLLALCQAADVSRSAVRHWLKQDRNGTLNLTTAAKLAKWFNAKLTPPEIPKPPETHRKPTKKGTT